MISYPQSGDSFGRYDIVRRIGRGGMGVVFEALHRDLKRSVAIKLLSPDLADAEDYRNRFGREAEVLARLDSPHIVRVFDAGEQDGWLFIATELIPGGDLDQMIRTEGALSAELALDLVGQVAEGLAATHELGVLHRDIKPSNVLLRRRGDRLEAVLCDLGISAILDGEHTKTSGVIGTLGYMAPERHDGEPATEASDLYSLGCLLFALLTGSAPYVGTDVRVAMGHMYEPVPQLDPSVPDGELLNPFLAVAMAKDPTQRFGSAESVRREARGLAKLIRDGATDAPTVEVAEPEPEPEPTIEETIRRTVPIEPKTPAVATAADPTMLRPSAQPESVSVVESAPTPMPASPTGPTPLAPLPTLVEKSLVRKTISPLVPIGFVVAILVIAGIIAAATSGRELSETPGSDEAAPSTVDSPSATADSPSSAAIATDPPVPADLTGLAPYVSPIAAKLGLCTTNNPGDYTCPPVSLGIRGVSATSFYISIYGESGEKDLATYAKRVYADCAPVPLLQGAQVVGTARVCKFRSSNGWFVNVGLRDAPYLLEIAVATRPGAVSTLEQLGLSIRA